MEELLNQPWEASLSGPHLQAVSAVLARMAALVFTLPVISSRHVPVRLRLAIALAMAVPVCMMVTSHSDLPPWSAVTFAATLLNELLIGAAMGFSAQVILAAAQLAGSTIEALCGWSFPELTGSPGDGTQGTAMTQIFWWTTAAVFVATGGATAVVAGAMSSFEWCPPGTGYLNQQFLEFLLAALANGFEFGLRAALPGIVALLVAGAVTAMAWRASPQPAAGATGLTVQSVTGLLVASLLLLTLPWIVSGGIEASWDELARMIVDGG